MRARDRRVTLALGVVLSFVCLTGCNDGEDTTIVNVTMSCQSITPNTGPQTGGTSVTLRGTGFLAGATVLFDGVAATGIVISPGGEELTCQTPSGSPGPVDVVVWNNDGSGCRILNGFVYTPVILNLNCGPCFTLSARCVTALGGDLVSVLCDCGAVFDGSTTVSIDTVPVTAILISPCEIQITTPPLAQGPHDVEVCDAWGCRTFPGSLAVPACGAGGMGVCSVAPPTGTRLGGDTVTISGCGFPAGAQVFFGATPAPLVNVQDQNTIIATTPASCPEIVDVTVRDPVGPQAVLTRGFTYMAGPSDPVLVSVTPASGPVSGGNSVTLNGTNFALGSIVYFGSTAAAISAMTATAIDCVVPAATSPGRVDVTVEDPGTACRTILECAYEYQ